MASARPRRPAADDPATTSSVIGPRHSRIALASLVLLTLLVYAPAIRGPQLFDDQFAIDRNPTITTLWPLSVPLQPPAQTPLSARPVVNLSFAVNYWINGLLGVDQSPDPGGVNKTIGYHLVNIAIHLCCGLLLLGIVRRTLASGRLGERWKADADVAAWLVAGIWLVHPLQTDAVDYMVQRTEVLMAFCYLATLYCSIRAWDTSDRRRQIGWFVAGTCSCLLGMGSKEVMVSAPLMIVLYDRAFRATSWPGLLARQQRRRSWFYAALAATWLLLIALVASAPRSNSAGFRAGMPWWEYLHSQGWAIAHYLRLAIVPAGLALDYGNQPIAHWHGLPGLIVIAAIAALTITAWTRANAWGWLAFLGSWFLLILAPSSSVVPIISEIAAERRFYLPLAAVVTLGVVGAHRWFEWIIQRHGGADAPPAWRRHAGIVARLIAGSAIAGLATLTFLRSRLYLSPEAIWRDSVAHISDNARGWNNLGVVLATGSAPNHIAADSMYREAVKRDTTFVDGLLHLTISDLAQQNYADATRQLQRIPLSMANDTALVGLSGALLGSSDTTGAMLVLARAASTPASADVLANLASVALQAGRSDIATALLQRAVTMDSSRTEWMGVVGGMLLSEGRSREAAPYLEELVRRQPGYAVGVATLAVAYAETGRTADAIKLALESQARAENQAQVLYMAGKALTESHRADLGEPDLARAAALAPQAAEVFTALGKAEMELGKRNSAHDALLRAVQLAPNDSSARQALSRWH